MKDFEEVVGKFTVNAKKVARDELHAKLRNSGGRLGNDEAEAIAAHANVTERTVWRWRAEFVATETLDVAPDERSVFERLSDDGADAFTFTDDLVDIVYAFGGNLHRVYEEIVKAGFPVPSYVTFTRRWNRLDPHVRDGARNGQRHRDRNSLKVRHTADRVDEVWEFDDLELDIEVLQKRGHKAVTRPHLLLLIDDRSRFVRAWALIDHAPRSTDVIAMLADAIVVRPAEDGSGVAIGGMCETLATDNASYFRSLLVEETIAQLPGTIRPTAAYAPTAKGKVERVNRTIQDLIVLGMAGMLTPAETRRKTASMAVDPGSLLTFDELVQLVGDKVYAYNYEHIHSSLGSTPIDAYSQHPGTGERVDDEVLAELMLTGPRAGGRRKVHPDGLHVFRRYYVHNALRGYLHKQVEVRTFHHRRDHVAMFHNDKFVAMVPDVSNLTEAQRREIVQGNIATEVAVNSHTKAARKILSETAHAYSTGGTVNPVERAAAATGDAAENHTEEPPPDRAPRPKSRKRSNPKRGGSYPAAKKDRSGLDIARQALNPDESEDT